MKSYVEKQHEKRASEFQTNIGRAIFIKTQQLLYNCMGLLFVIILTKQNICVMLYRGCKEKRRVWEKLLMLRSLVKPYSDVRDDRQPD